MAMLQTAPPGFSEYGGTSVHPPPKSNRVGARTTTDPCAGSIAPPLAGSVTATAGRADAGAERADGPAGCRAQRVDAGS